MFGKKRRGLPDRPFAHNDDCTIFLADPGVELPWSEVETRHWVRTCRCGEEHHHEPAPLRTRLDPLDPATSRHGGACEFKDTTDPAVLRVLLRIKPGLEAGYSWVECSACDLAWAVPDFAEESVG